MSHHEATELLGKFAVAMMHPGLDPGAWFLAHPQTLLPEFGAVMRQFVQATASEHDLEDPADPATLKIWCAQFVLRVQREIRRNGGPATFAKLRAAPIALGELNDRIPELERLITADDVFTAAKSRLVTQKFRDLMDHPGLLIASEPMHSGLLLWAARMLHVLYLHTLAADVLELQMEITRTGLDPAPAAQAAHTAMLDQLAFALADRYELSGGLQHMRAAARLHEQALEMTTGAGPERADRLNSLGACHRDLYHGTGDQASLERAIECFEESVRLRSATTNRNNLAVSLLDRSRLGRGTAADLDRAMQMFAAIAADSADGDPQLPRSLADHADALLTRSSTASGDAGLTPDLDRAIELTERALALKPAGVVLARCQAVHADALARRASLTGDRTAHDRALDQLEQVRSGLPASMAMADQAAGLRVMAVLGRWVGDRSDDNLRDVVAEARAALDVVRHDRATRARVTAILVGTVPAYAVATGDVAEIDRAIGELEAAGDYRTAARIDGLADTADVQQGLAWLHIERGRRTRELREVQRGLDLAAEVADAAMRTEWTARGWTERFMLTFDAGDLERALAAAEPLADRDGESFSMFTLWERLDDAACTGRPLADGSDLADALAGLWRTRSLLADPAAAAGYAYLASEAYARRSERTGHHDDLRQAAGMLEQHLATVPADSPRYGSLQMWAGSRWRELYTATGEPGHLARAIALLESAQQAAAPDSRLFRQACSNLGTSYRAQFNYTGELAALDRAITAYELGIDAGSDDPEWSTASMNLANALRASFDFTQDRVRLDRAIELHERVVAGRPPGDPDRPQALHNLATSRLTRYGASRERDDLDRAIAVSTEAADLVPPHTPMWQDMVSTLAILHETRFGAARDPADLDIAVRLGREAFAVANGSTSSRTATALRLAQILQTHCEHRAGADPAEAVRVYRQLCAADRPSFGEVPLIAAWKWLSWAGKREAWPEVVEACRPGVQIFGDLLRLQASRGLRAEFMRRYRGFTADAAFALARAGAPQEAVMALEVSRAFSLNDALQLHAADLARLGDAGHAKLADQFEAAVRAWAAASGPGLERSLSLSDEPRMTRNLADQDTAIRAARAEVDRLSERIRELPGQEEFLRPPEFGDVVAAASAEPLVYLVAAERGGIALIVRGEQIQVLPLPMLTHAVTLRWLTGWYASHARGDATLNWWIRLEELGRELWAAAIGPLAAELDDGPVTFVRTGYLELLPLTAAWTPDPSRSTARRYLLDEHNMRTVPNAGVLTVARTLAARAAGSTGRLLAVADPRPVTAPPLACATAEVAGVQCRYPAATVLAGGEAVPDAVLAGLGSHGVIHLACHGYADILSPLDSSLLLAGDQPLTLRDIIRTLPLRDRPVRLAVLSACETSIAGLGAPDEVISLPSGLLEIGVAGVVASQWRVPDLSAAITMIRFHAGWLAGSDPPAALRAAQLWLRDSTAAEISAYLASAGLPPEATRPLRRRLARMDPKRQVFVHPVHWAGFLYSGA